MSPANATSDADPTPGSLTMYVQTIPSIVRDEFGGAYVGVDGCRDVIATRRWDGQWAVAVTERVVTRRVGAL